MANLHSITMFLCAGLTFLTTGEAFFLYSNKKSSTERSASPQFAAQYYRDTNQGFSGAIPWSQAQQYSFDGTGPVTVALPVAVPIQTQIPSLPATLKGTVHNVQLVPCLCPVSKDIEPISGQSPSSSSSSSYIVQSGPIQSSST